MRNIIVLPPKLNLYKFVTACQKLGFATREPSGRFRFDRWFVSVVVMGEFDPELIPAFKDLRVDKQKESELLVILGPADLKQFYRNDELRDFCLQEKPRLVLRSKNFVFASGGVDLAWMYRHGFKDLESINAAWDLFVLHHTNRRMFQEQDSVMCSDRLDGWVAEKVHFRVVDMVRAYEGQALSPPENGALISENGITFSTVHF